MNDFVAEVALVIVDVDVNVGDFADLVDGVKVGVLEGDVDVREGVTVDVEDGVLVGVFVAGKVAVGSGVFVEVGDEVGVEDGAWVSVLVGVDVGVNVNVGGLPVNGKDLDAFHSLPIKNCTS